MRFKKGDKVVYIGGDTENMNKGNYYTVLNVHRVSPLGRDSEWAVEILDERGDFDIYHESLFEYDKNRIVKDILEDL